MAKIYYSLITKGEKTLEEVLENENISEKVKEQVVALVEAQS